MPVDLEEYLSDESTDMSFTACNYRKMRTPPTTLCPCPYTQEGAYRVIADHNEDIDSLHTSQMLIQMMAVLKSMAMHTLLSGSV